MFEAAVTNRMITIYDIFTSNRRRWLARWSLCLALSVASVGGCKTKPPDAPVFSSFNCYRRPQLEAMGIRRVVLLPLSNETGIPFAEERIREALAAELRIAGLFEVITPPPMIDLPHSAGIRSDGTFHESDLVTMARNFNADGVIFATVTDYRPYRPVRVGVNLHLVSTAEAITVASVDGLWDARDASVTQLALMSEPGFAESAVPGSDISLYSPEAFHRFVGRQIAQALAGTLPMGPHVIMANAPATGVVTASHFEEAKDDKPNRFKHAPRISGSGWSVLRASRQPH